MSQNLTLRQPYAHLVLSSENVNICWHKLQKGKLFLEIGFVWDVVTY